MSETKLEKIFKEKAECSGNIILHSQWITEKREIIKALDAISIFFPHYSLHNASHSESIINNITRVLGEDNLKRMSSVDLWLILEAAYCHDLGMVVSATDIEKALNVEESHNFIAFFTYIKNDYTHSLYEYTKYFELKENKLHYTCTNVQHHIHDAFKFLLAEYFRQKHGTRAEEIIQKQSNNSPLSFSMINQKNNIPPRLYGVLGRICSAHTGDFKSVLLLPFSECGINTEDAHPRFIACLLRLGDVLDVDNLRFSDPSLMTLDDIPSDTKIHIGKHASISHLRIDRKSIEITADTSDPKVANVTKQWFSWVQQEFDNQVTQWNNIVPHSGFGFLPTVGHLKVNLNNYEIPAQPAFTIDTSKALGLLRGTNIYNSWFDSIRELIQNAIDSMLIRQWLTKKDSTSPWNIDTLRKEVNDEYGKNDVSNCTNIKIDLKKNSGNIIFTIQDYGIGIDKEDLKFLSSPGSSRNNTRKRKTVEEMPVELQPSGIFGIGFQSVFLLTDQVCIKTKSYYSDEQYEMTMHSPTSVNKGDIYLKKILLSQERLEYGTCISFVFSPKVIEEDLNPDSVPFYDNFSMLTEKLDGELLSLQQTVFFNLLFNGKMYPKAKKWSYLTESKVEISDDRMGELYYKGMKVATPKPEEIWEENLIESFTKNYRGLSFNIHAIPADAILNISRNTLKRSKLDILKEKIQHATYEYICVADLDLKEEVKFSQSKFIRFYRFNNSLAVNSEIMDWSNKSFECGYYFNNILDFKLENKSNLISPAIILEAKEISLKHIDYEYSAREGDLLAPDRPTTYSSKVDKSDRYIILVNDIPVLYFNSTYAPIIKDVFVFYLKEILLAKTCFFKEVNSKANGKKTTDDLEYEYIEYVKRISCKEINENSFSCFSDHIFEFNSIFFLPITKKFENLLIDKKHFETLDYFYCYNQKYDFILSLDVMVIPYAPSSEKLNEGLLTDKFYQWVQDHLKNKEITIEEIKELYSALINTYK